MDRGNQPVANRNQNRNGADSVLKWIVVCTVILIFQIVIISLPGNNSVYWYVYDTSTDIFELSLSIALFSAISYSSILLKSCSFSLVIWLLFCAIFNMFIDYVADMVDIILISIFISLTITMLFSLRFLLRCQSNNTAPPVNKFSEIVGNPKNLSQIIVAMYTGFGGSFAITDGVYIWRYSKKADCMIREKLSNTYTMGKTTKEICDTFDEGYRKLDSMVGRKFTALHNCLELHSIAKAWA